MSVPDDTPGLGAFAERANDSMVVVTVAAPEGERSGCLVGFHTQCSIDPPRYAVGLSKANHTYDVALRSEVLAMNLLGADQGALAALFGGHTLDEGIDKFEHCAVDDDETGVPVLAGVVAWVVGRIIERIDVGDHVLHVLSPLRAGASDDRRAPLRFVDTDSIEPGHEA